MPNQTLVPVSATSTSSWIGPSNVLVVDNVEAKTVDTNPPGTGLVVYFGTLDSGGANVSVALTDAWTETNTNPKAVLNCWLSPDGASKIGSPTQIQVPFSPYIPGNTVNQINSTPMAVGFSAAQALAGMYLIIEQLSGGAIPNTTNLDYVAALATWTAISPVVTGAGSRIIPPFAFQVGSR